MVPTRTFGKVHAGFFDAFSSIRQKLLEHPLLQGPRPIFITGHSLGGALAILGAIYSAQLKMPLHSVYTFGQPRVGNAEFKSVYDALNIGPSGMLRERTFRFVNQEDIVPRVPGLLAGYRHCGLRLFFSTFGALELNPTFWAMALSDIFGIAEAWTTRREIVLLTDHPIARYIEELEKLQ
jgi:hypothetical protein